MSDLYYRYEETRYASSLDEFDNPIGEGRLEVNLLSYPVLKRTPKGAWIDAPQGRKFILTSANRRWACPTTDEAKDSFLARKKAQIRILSARMRDAKQSIEIVEQGRARDNSRFWLSSA
jgi:hypothetical protein